MKYLLINKVTEQSTICEKIEIGGGEFYISEEEIKNGDYILSKNSISPLYLDGKTIFPEMLDLPQWKKVVASNIGHVGIPQIVDELEYNYYLELEARREVAKNFKGQVAGRHPDAFGGSEMHHMVRGYLEGYQKAKETFCFTEKDLVEFAEWIADSKKHGFSKQLYEAMIVNRVKTTKELLDVWKEQQVKIVYYETTRNIIV